VSGAQKLGRSYSTHEARINHDALNWQTVIWLRATRPSSVGRQKIGAEVD
jgi:hypothetical protein